MSMYQDTPPDPNTAPIRRRPDLLGVLFVIGVFAAFAYGANYLNNSRQVTDTFEEFSVTHSAFWSQRDPTAFYNCESSAIGGCVADYLSNGRAASVEILVMRVASFIGGNALDNSTVQGGIDAVLAGVDADVIAREDITLSGLPAQRIEFSTSDSHGLLYAIKPSLYIHLFFALSEDAAQFATERADVEEFIRGVTFNVADDAATETAVPS